MSDGYLEGIMDHIEMFRNHLKKKRMMEEDGEESLPENVRKEMQRGRTDKSPIDTKVFGKPSEYPNIPAPPPPKARPGVPRNDGGNPVKGKVLRSARFMNDKGENAIVGQKEAAERFYYEKKTGRDAPVDKKGRAVEISDGPRIPPDLTVDDVPELRSQAQYIKDKMSANKSAQMPKFNRLPRKKKT